MFYSNYTHIPIPILYHFQDTGQKLPLYLPRLVLIVPPLSVPPSKFHQDLRRDKLVSQRYRKALSAI